MVPGFWHEVSFKVPEEFSEYIINTFKKGVLKKLKEVCGENFNPEYITVIFWSVEGAMAKFEEFDFELTKKWLKESDV